MNAPARPTLTIMAAALLALSLASRTSANGPDRGALLGVALDASGAALPGVTVTVKANGAPDADAIEQITDGAGRFTFEDIGSGNYTLVLSLDGFEDTTLPDVAVPADREVKAILKIAGVAETIVVRAQTEDALMAPTRIGESSVEQKVLEAVPLASERFEDALPLLPGVVRGPDGLLNMNGARADQSAFLLNGVNMTDPVTGHSSVRLPLEAIESANVHAGVQSAAYGSATGAVTDVVVRPGSDTLSVQAQNFLPRFRFADGGLRGIDAATPRLRISGPIQRGRVWYSEAASFRFVRSRVDELSPLEHSEQIVKSFDSVTQVDAALTPNHRLTTTFVAFPSNIDNAGIDTLHPYDATPDMKQRGWIAALTDGAILSPNATLTTTVAVKQFDMDVQPKGGSAALMTVAGHTGSYFNHFDRTSTRYDARSAIAVAVPSAWGEHLVRAGGDVTHTEYSGVDDSREVRLSRADGSVFRQIDYFGNPSVAASNTTISEFIEDQWAVAPQVKIHGGVRYAYEQIAGEQTLSPRLDAAYSPFTNNRTIVKGAIGLLYDKLPLNSADFAAQQSRRITTFDAQGQIASVVLLTNQIAGDGLDTPRTRTWNVELDQALTRTLQARVGYRESNGSHQLIVDPAVDQQALMLSSGGRARSHELEFTVRRQFKTGQVTASYVRSKAEGDLNDFVSLFGDLRDPVIQANAYSRLPFDVPNRFLVWGTMSLPRGIIVAPTVEYRSGFPYSVVDEQQNVVGARNQAGRFPNLFTTDLAVTKDVRLSKNYRARVGVQVFNLTDHFNPQDVQNNTASPTYGEYANTVDRQLRAKFTLLF